MSLNESSWKVLYNNEKIVVFFYIFTKKMNNMLHFL